jgi:hypothetical protein
MQQQLLQQPLPLQRPAASPASHLTSLASVLQIVLGMSATPLTALQVRKSISGLMPRLASQLGTEEAFLSDLKSLPSIQCLEGEGGVKVFKAK